MSLINQMLKDLEERRPAGAARDGVLQDVAAPRHAAGSRRGLYGWLPWAFVAVLAAGIGGLLWERGTPVTMPAPDQFDPAMPASPSVPPAVPTETPVAAPTPSPAESLAEPTPGSTTAAPAADAAAEMPNTDSAPALATAAPVTAAQPAQDPAEPATVEPVPAPAIAPAPTAHVDGAAAGPAPVTEQSAPPPVPPVAVAPRPATAPTLAARPSPPQVVTKTARPLSPAQQAELLYQDGAKQLRLGRLARAEDLLREAVATAPAHAQARHALAGLWINAGRNDDAIALLGQGLALDAKQSTLAGLYGRLLLERGAADEARGALEAAAPPLAADLDYHALLAAVYQRLGAHDAAIRQYQSLLRLRPGQGAWWIGLGISAEAIGDHGSAAQAYRQALASAALAPDLQRYAQGKLSTLKAPSR